MEVLRYPDPKLFVVCKEVTVFGHELKVLLEGMWDAMIARGGVGLASNQVGLDYRMFVMADANGDKMFIINPIVVKRSEVPAMMKEGCLSAPGEFLYLSERASWIQIDFKNEKGQMQRRVFQGLQSVCVQHEMDHLEGKSHLMSPSLSKKIRKELAKKWGLK